MAYRVTNAVNNDVTLYAENGNSVQIPARAKGVQVADIFAWNPPTTVRMVKISEDLVDPTVPVASTTVEDVVKPPKNVEEAAKIAEKSVVPPPQEAKPSK